MGWAGGSGIAANVWSSVEKYIPANQKKRVAKRIIDIFENEDCDTIDEAEELCKAAGRTYDDDDE